MPLGIHFFIKKVAGWNEIGKYVIFLSQDLFCVVNKKSVLL